MSYTKHPLYTRARYCFYDQIKRCEHENCKEYKWYGGKGIKVNYSLKEFLLWYFENAKGFKRPTIDRVDHEKDYCFSNIQIVEKSDNSKERIERAGTPLPRRKVIMTTKCGIFIREYESAYHAARDINGHPSNIGHVCKGERISHRGYSFKYKE